MIDVGWYLIYLLAGYVGFQLIIVVVVFVQVLRQPLAPARVERLQSLPALSADQMAAVEELRALGFELVGASYQESEWLSCPALLLRHSSVAAFAVVQLYPTGDLGYPVAFYSFCADGTLLMTSNRLAWLAFADPPYLSRQDPYADTLAAHWQAHQARLQGASLVAVSDAEAHSRLERLIQSWLPLMQERGLCTQDRTAWHPSLRAAAGAALAWLRVRSKLARRYTSRATTGENQVAYFTRCYAAAEAQRARRPERQNVKATLLVLSASAALLLWGLTWSWAAAVMLIAILLVHESGHALMMRRYGYRDMSMFFIPFIGAIVTGRPKELPSWKQAVILFAGPLPGLLAGLAILIAAALQKLPDWGFDWRLLGSMAVGVNFFNLLPIMPLDGGRLVELALFSRWPLSRLVFAAAGAIAMFIAVFLVLGLRTQYRIMLLQRGWREGLDREGQMRNLFEVAKDRLQAQSYARQAALVKAVLVRHDVHPARPWESALVLSTLTMFWGAGAAVALLL
jgi:Zn-dependent protease